MRLIATLVLALLGLPAAVRAQEDLALNFGPNGLWTLAANPSAPWSPLHPRSPESMVTADLDGTGQADLVVDFGSAGLWVVRNNKQWTLLHNLSPSLMAVGDLDGSGRDDLLVVFPGFGLWVWQNDATWRQLHPLEPSRILTGNLDSRFIGDEAIIEFPGFGLWWLSGNTWSEFYSLPVSSLVIANIAGGAEDDIVMGIPGYGVWLWADRGTSWTMLHYDLPAIRAAGNIDASPEEEVLVDFGAAHGIWSYSSTAGWVQLHAFPAESIALADRNGNGRKEVFIDFGPAWGLWQYDDTGAWSLVHPLSPIDMTAGWALMGHTLTFSQVPGGSFATPYVEAGLTVSPLSGTWTASAGGLLTFRGFNYLAPATTAELELTRSGQPFTFSAVELYSSLTAIPWVFTGYRNGVQVYSVSGQVPSLSGRTARVQNPRAADPVDRVVIQLTQPANTSCSTCGNNPLTVDNIVFY